MSIKRNREFTVEGFDKVMWSSIMPHSNNYQPKTISPLGKT